MAESSQERELRGIEEELKTRATLTAEEKERGMRKVRETLEKREKEQEQATQMVCESLAKMGELWPWDVPVTLENWQACIVAALEALPENADVRWCLEKAPPPERDLWDVYADDRLYVSAKTVEGATTHRST